MAISQAEAIIPEQTEVEAGFSVPRPPVHLVKTAHHQIRAKGRDDPNLDATDQLQTFANHYLSHQQYDSAILKSRSPSCGIGTTPIYTEVTKSEKNTKLGNGIFAQTLIETDKPRLSASCLLSPQNSERSLDRMCISLDECL